MLDWLNQYIAEQKRALDSIKVDEIAPLIRTLREAHRAGRQIFVCGNGGSAANASHFVTDLGKNSSEAMGVPFKVLSLNDNTKLEAGQGLIPVQVLGAPPTRGQISLKEFAALRQSAQLGQIAG